MKRKVIAVIGDWDSEDFVLEPACDDLCQCTICEDAFWIERVEDE